MKVDSPNWHSLTETDEEGKGVGKGMGIEYDNDRDPLYENPSLFRRITFESMKKAFKEEIDNMNNGQFYEDGIHILSSLLPDK